MLAGEGSAEVGTAEAFKPRHVASEHAAHGMLDSAILPVELP